MVEPFARVMVVGLFADIILIFHFCVVIFITLGFFLVPIGYKLEWSWVKNRKLRTVHCGMMVFVTLETLFGMTCPLTLIENNLRGVNQSKSFIAYWIEQIIYWDFPIQFFLILYFIFLAWTFLIWRLFPPKNGNSAR